MMKKVLNVLMGLCLADAIVNRVVSASFEAQGKIDLATLVSVRELVAIVAIGVLLMFWRVS